MDGPIAAAPTALLAPAKLNLSLHVVGRRADGLHRLEGLVAFCDVGDRLTIAEAPEDRLDVAGPMAAALDGAPNILTRALDLARTAAARRGIRLPALHLRLEKHLPVASGVGGGSADAAALLRWIVMRFPAVKAEIEAAAVTLGADVPMCLSGRPARVTGIGDELTLLPRMPKVEAILVNPGVAVATAAVYARLDTPDNSPPPPLPDEGFGTLDGLVAWLVRCRNDLEPAAIALAPEIETVRTALSARGAGLARMSGSGATVFGLFADAETRDRAAGAIASTHPNWWVAPTTLLPSREI